MYVEDLKRGANPAEKGGRPKDIFEIASNSASQLSGSSQIFMKEQKRFTPGVCESALVILVSRPNERMFNVGIKEIGMIDAVFFTGCIQFECITSGNDRIVFSVKR